MTDMDDILRAKAAQLAEHDGAPVSPVYLHAAANALSAEVRQALDKAMNHRAPAVVAELAPEAPAPEPEAPAVEDAPATTKPATTRKPKAAPKPKA